MHRRLPSLTSLRAFEAAARHLSFTQAASELCVTPSAISRQIKHLEDYLGRKMFVRHSRSLELTPTGSLYYETLRNALDIMERGTHRVLGVTTDNIITLNVLPTFALYWLMPRLGDFNACHPGIEVRLMTSIQPADFRSDIDLAIRVRNPQGRNGSQIELTMTEDRGIAVDYLVPDVPVPVCTPAVLAKPPAIKKPADLLHVTRLHTSLRPHAWRDWFQAAGVNIAERMMEGPTFGQFMMSLQAALHDKGIACLPLVLVENDIAAGRLVEPFPEIRLVAGEYCLLYRENQQNDSKIAAFRKWILQQAHHDA